MAQRQQKKKAKGTPKRATTNRGRCVKFFSGAGEHRRVENTLARILKSNGPAAARKWAEEHGVLPQLRDIAKYGEKETGGQSKAAQLAEQALGKK